MEEIIAIDKTLSETSRDHELILISNLGTATENLEISGLTGPVSIVYTNSTASLNQSRAAALSRAAGDFIIEWQGEVSSITTKTISEMLEPTNNGVELVEYESNFQPALSRFFYKIANSLRSSQVPVRSTVARAFSRRALGLLLASSKFEPQINILFADLQIRRTYSSVNINYASRQKMKKRISEGISLLSKGSRFGTVVPLGLAMISGSLGFFSALYALWLYFLNGKSPEGWTALMVVTGLSQASILALIGMIWSRIDSLSKGLSQNHDATAEVEVFSPSV